MMNRMTYRPEAEQQPGPYASGYVYPGTPAPGPPGPWSGGYNFPEDAPPPQPPQAPAPEPPDSSQTQLGTPPPAAAAYDSGSMPPGQPPHAAPAGPDYHAIVNSYLRRLTAPMPYPMPKPLTGAQALAVEMNPARRDELLKTFNAPYERNMAAFQYGEARDGRAATVASGMAKSESLDRYRAMHADALNAYQKIMAWHAGQRVANDTARTNAYVNRTQKGTGPQDWMKSVGQLDKEIAAAAKDVTSGSSGAYRAYGEDVKEPTKTTLGETEDRYRQLRALRQRIQTVTSNPEFQKRSRDFQNRVVERLMSGFGTQSQEEVPPPPPATPADFEDYGE